MGRVLVVGALGVELAVALDHAPAPGETVVALTAGERRAGGSAGNQAVAARAAGADVTVVAAVGDDDGGRDYRRRLEGLGITAALDVVPSVATGLTLVMVDDGSGTRSRVVLPGATTRLADLSPFDGARPGDVVLVDLEVPAPTVTEAVGRAARAGARVVLHCSTYAALPPEVVALADPFVVGQREAGVLADGHLVPRSLLVTFGARGAVWDGERVDGIELPGDEVVDTTGAHDAFCGALVAALAAGLDRRTAMARAVEASADALRHEGGQPDPRL